jgi:RNA-directed DNA polymerase
MFERIANFQALCEAAQRAAKGKRRKPGVAGFLANLERNVLRLERELVDGTWRPGNYTVIEVRDPKPRRVSAAPFRDRVVHHALCAVVEQFNNLGFRVASTLYVTGAGAATAAPGASMSVQSLSW